MGNGYSPRSVSNTWLRDDRRRVKRRLAGAIILCEDRYEATALMEQQFKFDDTVALHSGGHLMMVVSTDGKDVIKCAWFAKEDAQMMAMTYASDKARIQSELMKLANAGKVTYYGVLGAALSKHPQWPGWTIVLGEILLDQQRRESLTSPLFF